MVWEINGRLQGANEPNTNPSFATADPCGLLIDDGVGPPVDLAAVEGSVVEMHASGPSPAADAKLSRVNAWADLARKKLRAHRRQVAQVHELHDRMVSFNVHKWIDSQIPSKSYPNHIGTRFSPSSGESSQLASLSSIVQGTWSNG